MPHCLYESVDVIMMPAPLSPVSWGWGLRGCGIGHLEATLSYVDPCKEGSNNTARARIGSVPRIGSVRPHVEADDRCGHVHPCCVILKRVLLG